ncbi:hypothetical protein N8Z31_00015 [Pelagibacteraceae bacterium]|jgi:outer membrane protein assembly factor BamE (lipoprotein component of BamABCDE complex)|nr:hypothetical protein [Pelagibacteraceae bacterium]
MKKLFILIFIYLQITSCSFKEPIKHHGVHLLEKKSDLLIIAESNRNDIIKILGPPSTESKFDNDLLIFIERKTTTGRFLKFGRKRIIVNNVLIAELDNTGILLKKELIDVNKMREVKFSSKETTIAYKKERFIYRFLSSLRQKVNDPLGKRKK